MVKLITRTFLFSLIIAFASIGSAWAAEFTASVREQTVESGDPVVLTLTLKDASAFENPDLSALEKDFQIFSQAQSSQTRIINGRRSSAIAWTLHMTPRRKGKVTIPSISLKTNEGQLQTQAIEIRLVERQANQQPRSPGITSGNKSGKQNDTQSQFRNKDVFVVAETTLGSNQEVYKNQPFLYTIKMVAVKPLRDLAQPETLTVDGAIVEIQGDPDLYAASWQGKRIKILESKYLITPIKTGKLEIPPQPFSGRIDPGSSNDPFQFGLMEQLVGKEFGVSGGDLTVNVKEPEVEMNPWLPLTSLKLDDEVKGAENAKVGEPITRRIMMVVQGNIGSVLPDLEARSTTPDFRVYADKPETGFNINQDGKTLSGWRQENYTLIPKNPGELTLPAIKVEWWDVNTKKKKVASLPARTITVSGTPAQVAAMQQPPAASTQAPSSSPSASSTRPQEQNTAEQELESAESMPFYMYLILGALALLVLVQGMFMAMLLKRSKQAEAKAKQAEKMPDKKAANEDRIKPQDLKKAKDAPALKAALHKYAKDVMALPDNASFRNIGKRLSRELSPKDAERAKKLLTELEAILYAGKDHDLESIKNGLADVLSKRTNKKKSSEPPKERLGKLNPS